MITQETINQAVLQLAIAATPCKMAINLTRDNLRL